jgi:ABC-type multidrug transport system fused ATPase/permease subunit
LQLKSFPVAKFISYYRPYLRLFVAVLICALIAAGASLLIPLCIRSLTKTMLDGNTAGLAQEIFRMGALMLALLAVQVGCGYFVDYRGHVLGAKMESDLRSELFAHYLKLPFGFYDEQKTGQLMSRLTHDLLNLAELYHHAPEDYLIYLVKFGDLVQHQRRTDLGGGSFSAAAGGFCPVFGETTAHRSETKQGAHRRRERPGRRQPGGYSCGEILCQ